MFKNIIRVLGGDPNRREVERLAEIVNQVNALESEFEALSDEALSAKTVQFRQQIADATDGIEDDTERYQVEQSVLEEILPEAFAAVREASKRTIGLRHYDVQLIGGMTLHNGKIAEMRTGEGKTLVATLALYLNALSGRGTHLVTVNDYLARRDARWMAPIYHMLGLSVGVLQMASRTENGRNAFLVDFDRKSPHEDQHQLRMVPRREAYLADITYGTNSEFGFDYLRDNTTMRLEDRSQRGHHYAIIDEVDNILIDEARTPLIISGPASEDVEWYYRAAQVVKQLRPEDYEISEKDRQVTLTELGEAHVEQLLEMPLRDPERPEDITPEQARILGYLEQALRAQFLYRRNKEYLVQAGKVVIVDEFTGRLMPGRRWSDGLHQAVEAKEGVKVEAENVTYATITLQNYFRMYTKLAGMTGTALTEAEEFAKIYKLDVLPIPTNLEFQAMKKGGALVALEDRDEERYKYTYYARSDDPAKTPIYFKRKDYPDVVYRTEEAKLRAITQEIVRYYILGRPQLVGTTSVEHSDRLSNRLRPELLRRLMQTVIIRDAWMTKHHIEINERAIPELQILYTPLESLNVADMRPLARQLDLSMNPEDDRNVDALMRLFVLAEADRPVLLQVLQAGIPHQVLNARKHDEESKIIARAGAFRAVTIATNMAGRGVDIKLGGELPDEIYQDVHRVLGAESYEMTLDERYDALKRMDEAEYGIYEEGVRAFLQYVEEMRKVRELGGLHVIGSERHEARRIDNQLRGRSARQGDPGSSRFYLSLEDDLMRMFGGEQAEGLLKRFNVDEAVPMEVALVGRLIEQSQTRVEGANFDIRKHLLEYDDVLNSQRKRIYEQRDRIFLKDDLAEDVSEMLHTDLQARIRPALEDEEGPWKLLAYLDEVQPPFDAGGTLFPSFTLQVLLADLLKKLEGGKAGRDWVEVLSDVARQALQAESDHILKSTKVLLEKAEESYEAQVEERMEAVDTFFEGLRDREDDLANRRYTALNEELSSLVRFTVRLNAEQWEQAAEKPAAAVRQMRDQLEAAQIELTLRRLFLTLDTRLEESLGLKPAEFVEAGWGEIHAAVLEAVEKILNRRMERLVGAGGQIRRDLEAALEKTGANQALSESQMTTLLLMMLQGTRQVFDQKTHRRTFQRTTRLRYNYLAARLLEERPAQEVTDEVLAHLERAQEFLMRAYGAGEFVRLQQLGATLTALDEITRTKMEDTLGEALFIELAAKPFAEIPTEHQPRIMETLGRRIQTEIYRQLLLGVISELWVDYLTRVEALRVSIGLEAYAQRDPLVMYKGRASEMFTELLANIRSGVVSRMFTVRPRAGALAQLEQARGEPSPSMPAVAAEEEAAPGRAAAQSQPSTTGIQPASGGKKKRKRH